MDEKVLFNPPTPENPENQPSQGVPSPGADQVAGDGTDQTASNDQAAADDQTATGETIEEAPAGFLGGLLGGIMGGGLIKKLFIGIGSVILLTIIIILLIPKGQPDKAVTLTWWGLWEDTSTMQSLILDYHKTHPNVTINYIKNDPDQYFDRLQARLQNGTGPDIFLFHNTWLPMLNSDLSPLSTNVI